MADLCLADKQGILLELGVQVVYQTDISDCPESQETLEGFTVTADLIRPRSRLCLGQSDLSSLVNVGCPSEIHVCPSTARAYSRESWTVSRERRVPGLRK